MVETLLVASVLLVGLMFVVLGVLTGNSVSILVSMLVIVAALHIANVLLNRVRNKKLR